MTTAPNVDIVLVLTLFWGQFIAIIVIIALGVFALDLYARTKKNTDKTE